MTRRQRLAPGARIAALMSRGWPHATRRGLVLSALALLLCPGRSRPADDQPARCEIASTLGAYGLGTPGDDLARMAADLGAAPLRPDLIRRPSDRASPLCGSGAALPVDWWTAPAPPGEGLGYLPVTLNLYGNTAYPRDFNDGAVWEGRGVSSLLSGGVAFRSGIFSAAIAPGVAWQQNASFTTVPVAGDYPYMNPWYGTNIDLPQRFGSDPFWTLSPGQSYLRIDHAGFAAGVSTENLWWGPAMRNSILMSNTAGGIPHAFAGTGRPVDIGVGRLEGQLYLGRLDRSKYFPDQSHAWMWAAVMDYEPRWIPGLFLGFGYVTVTPCVSLQCNADLNGIMSLFARWVFPEVGFEVYGEYGREDSSYIIDFLKEPDHSEGYTLGLQKVWAVGGHWVRFRLETTNLQQLRSSRPSLPTSIYYTHPDNLFYTHGGQLIGAAIGPGGSGQFLGVDVLTPSGWWGGYLERVRRHEDVFQFDLGGPKGGNDVELSAGFRWVRALGDFDLGADLSVSHRFNRDFVVDAQANVRLAVEVTFWPSSARPGR